MLNVSPDSHDDLLRWEPIDHSVPHPTDRRLGMGTLLLERSTGAYALRIGRRRHAVPQRWARGYAEGIDDGADGQR